MTGSNNVVFDATVDANGLAGSVATVLARNVRHLEPESATFTAMLEGWGLQQRSRFLKASTIGTRSDMVRRFARFTNEYPWQWRSVEVEEFVTGLRSSGRPVAPSTARGYQNALRLFVEYVTDSRYGWPELCIERFGAAPSMILHEWNTVTHVTEYEGDPHRRPLTYDEVQALFDAAESLVDDIRKRGRKGARAAQRDAVLIKTIYAFGLRRREAWGLDLADLRHNPHVAQFGRLVVCSFDGGSRRKEVSPSVGQSSWCPRWTGSCRSSISGSMSCGWASGLMIILRCG